MRRKSEEMNNVKRVILVQCLWNWVAVRPEKEGSVT